MVAPPLGGAAQRVSRLGARWRAVFSLLPGLKPADLQTLSAARANARAAASTITYAWPQAGAPPALGSPVVNGAGQLGTLLTCSGFTAGVTIPAGLFFSVSVAGRGYLYATTAAVTADGSGNAILSIAPLLRAAPAASAALNFAAPQIEGYVEGTEEGWRLDRQTWGDFSGFAVTEAQ
jgi:hypothetical protein